MPVETRGLATAGMVRLLSCRVTSASTAKGSNEKALPRRGKQILLISGGKIALQPPRCVFFLIARFLRHSVLPSERALLSIPTAERRKPQQGGNAQVDWPALAVNSAGNLRSPHLAPVRAGCSIGQNGLRAVLSRCLKQGPVCGTFLPFGFLERVAGVCRSRPSDYDLRRRPPARCGRSGKSSQRNRPFSQAKTDRNNQMAKSSPLRALRNTGTWNVRIQTKPSLGGRNQIGEITHRCLPHLFQPWSFQGQRPGLPPQLLQNDIFFRMQNHLTTLRYCVPPFAAWNVGARKVLATRDVHARKNEASKVKRVPKKPEPAQVR